MTVTDALAKTCPFMTRPIHESSFMDGIAGTTMQWFTYCMTDGCMAWITIEPTQDGIPQGYCTLVEKELQ